MIRTEVSVHDNFSIEFNTSFLTNNSEKNDNEFKINTWMFVPNGLDVNGSNYAKSDFYRDVKKNIRLITPVYSLATILTEGKGPFARLDRAISSLGEDIDNIENTEHYAYQMKMLQCISQSAMRQEAEHIVQGRDDKIVDSLHIYVENVRAIMRKYRRRRKKIYSGHFTEQQCHYYSFGDEFLGNIIEQSCYYLLENLKGRPDFKRVEQELFQLIRDEESYKKKRSYLTIDKDNEQKNKEVIIRRSILKKYIESDLFLHTVKKKDGAIAERVYYTAAAGIAMIIATIVSSIATQRYGGYTSSLFIIVVVSYLLRDTLKDAGRAYFQTSMSKKYFDTKSSLSIRQQEIGIIKESFDYVDESKVSSQVMDLRHRTPLFEAESKTYDEKIILYRKWVSLSKSDIEKYKEYRLSGIRDITRLNLLSFTHKMDNPSKSFTILDGDELTSIDVDRVYALYFILQCKSDSKEYFKSYKVLLNRNGIQNIKELS